MRRMLSVVLTLICLLGMAVVQAAPVEFTYTGYVKVQGSYFSGPGQFKFAIVNRTGTRSFWSNDGTSRFAMQPTAALPLNVIDGYFAVAIGDTEAGMDPLDAAAFNSDQQYYLRVWFNDGTHGFERLTPDQRIVNPALLGATQQSSTIIYVNPVTGDDANVGNVADSPKKTIQAAWNTLPTIINTTATIQLQDGVYRDVAIFSGKTCVGDARILMSGNSTTRSLTRITGATAANETSGTVRLGIEMRRQSGLIFRDLTFDHHTFSSIVLRRLCEAEIQRCTFAGIYGFGVQGNQCTLVIRDSEFGPEAAITQNRGINVAFSSYLELRNTRIHHVWSPIYVHRNSNLASFGCTYEDCRGGGIEVYASSMATYDYPMNVFRNLHHGTLADSNSDMTYATSRCQYVNVQFPILTTNGSFNSYN